MFTWSIPFLAEKVTEMLFSIVGSNTSFSPTSAKDLDNISDLLALSNAAKSEEGEARMEILRTKVKTVARLTRIFKNLR